MNEEILRKLAQNACDAYVALDDDDPRVFGFYHDSNPHILPSERVVITIRREHRPEIFAPVVTFAGAVTV